MTICNFNLDILWFAKEIVGKPGSIVLKTNIFNHIPDNDLKKLNLEEGVSDIIIIGKEGENITLDDVVNAFVKIEDDDNFQKCFDSGRTYFFEQIRYTKRKNSDSYELVWGS